MLNSVNSARATNVEKGGLMLFLEWVLFFVLLLPNIFLAYFRWLMPPRGKSLNGKVVLVTGAARGLGRELALTFAKHGCKVACVDIDQINVLETAADIVRDGDRARAYTTNVANIEEIKELRQAVTKDLGPVDILVNNAALVYNQKLEDTPDDAVKAVVGVNFLSHVWMVREFLPTMKERNSGHVVAISSLSAHSALANASMYVSCKWAVTGFMESLRLEVLEQGHKDIHFTTVFPTFMDTAVFNTSTGVALNSRQKAMCLAPETVAFYVIMAVRRNMVSISIPEYLYYWCIVGKLLPTTVTDWAHRLKSGGGMFVSKEVLEKFDPIISDTVNQ